MTEYKMWHVDESGNISVVLRVGAVYILIHQNGYISSSLSFKPDFTNYWHAWAESCKRKQRYAHKGKQVLRQPT